MAGSFPTTEHRNKNILAEIRYFSKWVETYALPNQEVTAVTKVLLKDMSRFGAPLEVRCDQARYY